MKRELFLFDFDGTITTKDSLFDFLKFSFPKEYKKAFFLFSPLFIIAKLNILDTGKVKEKFISYFLKGKSFQEIESLGNNYFNLNKDTLIIPEADKYIKSINNYNDKYLVSASLDIWLMPFADYYGMGLICTKAEYDNNSIFTGKFLTPNCNYSQKKIRIENEIDLSLYDSINVFGDTKGDMDMLSLATNKFFKHF